MVGGMTSDYWSRDPKRLGFVLARYKFVARMVEGMERVLEVGCADGFGSRIVRQHVGALVAIDSEFESIREAMANQSSVWPIDYLCHELRDEPLPGFDAVYALDVLEHIPSKDEDQFLRSMRGSGSVAIIGMPSLESQGYASDLSRQGHVNCKRGPDLKEALKRHWKNVFLFGMNDETLHTGFAPMAHYRLALCTS